MNQLLKIFAFASIMLPIVCKQGDTSDILKSNYNVIASPINDEFNKYWFSGTAELNSYELKQARYGEIRNGEVVLVFVTEPFSLKKQVKLDNPDKAGKDKVSVMKLNHIRKFKTGVYDYSIVSSIFTPIDQGKNPHTLKLNTSIQEWCGHTFTQLNLKDDKYDFQQLSYFEADGDTKKSIPVALLEEELMTRIRLNNGQLPTGEIDLIFSTIYSRFAYQDLQGTKANITKKESEKIISYNIDYLNYDRKLTIGVQKEFPHKILYWTADNGDGLITEARLKNTINEPYWNQKKLTDESKRKELQLSN